MATECEDLRLSLSLCSSSHNNLPLNLTLPIKTQYVDLEAEEDARTWSPVSTLSCLSGKRSRRDDNEGEEDGQQNSGKKLRLSKAQITILEQGFNEHNTLSTKHKQALARHLNLRPRQVEVWFQNRRARTKLKQTEVEYEYLKRWCQNLTKENKRLQKEASELRKQKLAPPKLQFLASPPSTLTMCPSCERTAISNTGSSKTITPSSPPLQLLPGSHQNLWASYLFNRAS